MTKPLKILTLICAVSIATLTGCSSSLNNKGLNFDWRVSSTDCHDKFFYEDSYFSSPSTSYNPQLATCSLAMAMSSGNASIGGINNYSNKDINIKNYFTSIKMQDIYTSESYKQKPQANSIAYCLGHKPIKNGANLLAVSIRSAGYETEWAGNFNVGEKGNHLGFSLAASNVLEGIKSYISTNNLSGDYKIWIAGFSRGGATTNILAGKLDEMVTSNETLSGIVLKKENIYAYTFEAPMGVLDDNSGYVHSATFNNIFNIYNHNDFVPKILPRQFEFARYGVECMLPSNINTFDYLNFEGEMVQFYNSSDSYRVNGEYKINNFEQKEFDYDETGIPIKLKGSKKNWPLGLFMDNLMAQFAMSINSRQDYYTNIQPGITEFLEKFYLAAPGAETEAFNKFTNSIVSKILDGNNYQILIDDIFRDSSKFVEDLKPIIIRAFFLSDIKLDDYQLVFDGLAQLLKVILEMAVNNFDIIATLVNLTNIGTIPASHYMNLCLSWMKTMDKNYTNTPISYSFPETFTRITVSNFVPSDVQVTNDDKVVASFVRNLSENISNSSIAYGTDIGIPNIFLPSLGKYKLRISRATPKTHTYVYKEVFNIKNQSYEEETSQDILIPDSGNIEIELQ